MAPNGNIWVAGASGTFPLKWGTFSAGINDPFAWALFLVELDAATGEVLYMTTNTNGGLGHAKHAEFDAAGNLYVTGSWNTVNNLTFSIGGLNISGDNAVWGSWVFKFNPVTKTFIWLTVWNQQTIAGTGGSDVASTFAM